VLIAVPTTQQFTAAYKPLLMRSTIEGGKGNCKKLDPTSILHIIDDTYNVNEEVVSITNAQIIRKYDLETRVQDNSSRVLHFLPIISTIFPSLKRHPYPILQDMLQK
jgi:hypothetical protein